jgi:hypothetical protein
MRTGDLRQLAADLALEHGSEAAEYARRAVLTLEYQGEEERAQFWFALSILLDDIITHHVDPDAPLIIH